MAARFCSQCGQEVSSVARFCPNCAAPLEGAGSPRVPRPAAPAMTTPAATTPAAAVPIVTTIDAAAQKSRKMLIPGMIAALAVLAAAVIVLAYTRPQPSLIVSPASPPLAAPAVTNAPTAPPIAGPPLTNAASPPPMTAPAVTNAPNAPAPVLPPEVAAYLNFLQGIEQRRIAMNNDVSGATAMLGAAQGLSSGQGMPGVETDPEGTQEAAKQSTQKISQGYNDYALKWQGLIRDFRATPAPPACTPLAARYTTFLSDYTTVITKMQVALLNHDSSGLPDLSAVAQVQSQVNTDGAQADTELGSLCARYGVNKPFTIAPEGAAPSLLGH